MKLLDNWKSAWKWFSVQLMAAGVAVQGAIIAFPSELHQYLSDKVMHAVAGFLFGSAIFTRLLDQKKPTDG